MRRFLRAYRSPIVKAGGVWRENISGFFKNPIDKRGRICYNIIRRQEIHPHSENADTKPCGSGGTGRRARLRGVWEFPYGFKSRFPHQSPNPIAKLVRVFLLFFARYVCRSRAFLFSIAAKGSAAAKDWKWGKCVSDRYAHPLRRIYYFHTDRADKPEPVRRPQSKSFRRSEWEEKRWNYKTAKRSFA